MRIPRGVDTLFDIEIIGNAAQVEQMLNLLDRCFSETGMQRFLGNDATDYLRSVAKGTFENEGGRAVGGKWKQLAPATVEIRERGIARGDWPLIGPSHPINKRTGDLEEYITQGRGDVRHTSSSSALYYPQRPQPSTKKGLRDKVRRAQSGGGRTPARPVLGVTVQDMNILLTKLGRFIQRGGA